MKSFFRCLLPALILAVATTACRTSPPPPSVPRVPKPTVTRPAPAVPPQPIPGNPGDTAAPSGSGVTSR